MRQIKIMPFQHGKEVYAIAIVKRDKNPDKNCAGHDCDYSLAFLDEKGEFLNMKEMDMNDAFFILMKYVWCSSMPMQWVKEIPEPEVNEDRWEAVADDV